MTGASPGLVDVLSLERIEADLFRPRVIYDDPFGLYGGQVAAQALQAAAQTVDPARHPHSLHGWLAAGIAQESLFRPGTRRRGPPCRVRLPGERFIHVSCKMNPGRRACRPSAPVSAE
jgi:hypothetical protein